jgi:hypothetical protein
MLVGGGVKVISPVVEVPPPPELLGELLELDLFLKNRK